jgi:hypothetical protein
MTQTVTTLANGNKQVVITGSETWVIPADWNDSANKFEAYGRGGNGAAGTATQSGGGGGSGAYQSLSNFPLKYYTNLDYTGSGTGKVAKITSIDTSATNYVSLFQVAGGDDGAGTINYSFFTVGCAPGNDATGISGGGIAISIPTSFNLTSDGVNYTNYTTPVFSGAVGGSGRVSATAAGGGGAGAAGPNGAGAAGGTNNTTNPTIGRGGGGGNGGTAGSSTSATAGTAGTGAGAGGAGGAASTSGTAGGNGTNVATSYVFSGGGGGGAGDGLIATSGGAGGAYGGGGGGGASSILSTGGAGSIGVYIITYTPISTATGNMFLMF